MAKQIPEKCHITRVMLKTHSCNSAEASSSEMECAVGGVFFLLFFFFPKRVTVRRHLYQNGFLIRLVLGKKY